MIAGRLDKRITFQYQGRSSDGAGGWITSPITVGPVWAEFVRPRVNTMQEAGAVVSEMVREIRIRHRTDIKKGWKVLHGSRTFAVEHAFDEGRDSTIIICREVVK